MPALAVSGRMVGRSGQSIVPGAAAPAADVTITFTRVTPVRASTNRFNLGITFTQDTFPSGSQATAVANAKALMTAIDWDYVNMHNHLFGANGPWTNTDKNAGKTYAQRATWTGWTAWDARLQLCRDCSGPNTKLIISLLPPGWCKMDGGAKATAASDPLGLGRTWDTLDNQSGVRHTDAHVADMVNIAKAIGLRHSDVLYFSCFNEQKGNFTPHDNPTEMSNHGLTNVMDYVAERDYMEALRTGLDGAGLTGVEIMGPYHVLEANGADLLAATYLAQGFPQPAAAANAVTNRYKQYYATGAPLLARNVTFLNYYLANVSSAARSNWLALDWKTLGGDNDSGNWGVFYAWRWHFFEAMRAQIQAVKLLTGLGSSKIIAMESYSRKVDDDNHLPSDAEQGAQLAEMLRIELEEGVHGELRWAPEQGDGKNNRNNLFTSTTDTLANGGGVALPAYYSYKAYADNFRGVNVYACTSSDDKAVTAVASPTKTLLINKTATPKTASVNGTLVSLSGYEVKVVTL